jgi:DNA-3-methyladenine glycosylase II
MKADILTDKAMRRGVNTLRRRDPDLGRLVDRHGVPPMWGRPAGFATLVQIVLEQQVSLASARAVFERLKIRLRVVDAGSFLGLGDDALRACGFSRQKSRYCRLIAAAIDDGTLDLDGIAGDSDDIARRKLVAITGIGPWTANIYLLMALRRRDIWPVGDLALAVAAQRLKQLPAKPNSAEMEAIGEVWRPWRAVAARLLWQSYLNDPEVKRR